MVADILQESKDAQYVLDIDEMSSLLLGTSQNVLRIEIVILPTDDLFHRGGWINHHLDIHFSGVQTMIIYGNISEALLVSWWVWLTSWRSCGYHLRWENGKLPKVLVLRIKMESSQREGSRARLLLYFHSSSTVDSTTAAV